MEFPLHYSLNRVGLPLIITSSKPTLCFLIDTGASHNESPYSNTIFTREYYQSICIEENGVENKFS